MAFQMYVQPRGGDNIAAGISQAGTAIGQGIRDMRDRKEQRKQDSQLMEGFKRLVGADPDLAASLGIQDESDWDDFSPNQIRGAYEGLKMQAAQGARATEQLRQSESQLRQSEIQQRMQAAQEAQGAQTAENWFLRDAGAFAANPNMPFSPEFQDRASAFLDNPQGAFASQYAAETGYSPSKEFMDRYGPQAAFTPGFVPADQLGGPEGGMVFQQSPKSAQFIPAVDNDAGRRLPPEEILYDAAQAARAAGDFEKAAALEEVWERKMRGTPLSPFEIQMLVMQGVLSKEQASELVTGKAPAAAPGAPPPPTAKPMTREEFLNF